MRERCIQLGENIEKIKCDFVQDGPLARLNFLEHFAEVINERQNGNWSVAEAGVYRGEFSKEINRVFSKKKIYLFDTFEGFDERDFAYEELESYAKAEHFSNTNVELVLDKLPYPENAIVRKGYFPETAAGVDDKFGFVSLDMDLYQPILEGLKFFYPRLVVGGGTIVR
jgi:O-methyltransferase